MLDHKFETIKAGIEEEEFLAKNFFHDLSSSNSLGRMNFELRSYSTGQLPDEVMSSCFLIPFDKIHRETMFVCIVSRFKKFV